MKSLVIAEKPSVGRDIARVLNCQQKGNGYFEGKQYVVTWALGHLVTLADPESYDDKYKNWSMETLPMLPSYLKTEVIKKTSRQFGAVRTQIQRGDVGTIIIATDAGREGELVARWIIDKAKVKKPMKRLWISSVTDKAIREGFNKLKDARQYDNLYRAAVARAEADWLVGLNATRALTVKYNAQLSCGRVQTPTLAIVAKRGEQIRQFRPKTFYTMTIKGRGIKFTWKDSKKQEYKTYDKAYIDKVRSKVEGHDGVIKEVNKKAKKTYSPALYDLTELQRDANRLYKYSAKETLRYMQSLYENHKVLTYPRTDSRYLSTDIVPTIKERLSACQTGPYKAVCSQLMKKEIKGGKHFVDNSKVSDHHAIIPTEQGVNLGDLTNEERKIYDLVVKRFLAVLSEPFEYEQTDLLMDIKGELFAAKGKVVKSQGWRAIYDKPIDEQETDEIAEQILPEMKQGEIIKTGTVTINEGKTKPPIPFTEATLLSAMENPAKYMEETDKQLIKTLQETKGLGTVATRADIIEKLFNSQVLEKKDQYIHLTSKGRQILDLAPTALCSPVLTARWEQKLADIADGKLKKSDFEAEIRNYTVEIVNNIKSSTQTYRHDNVTGKKCPQCGKLLLQINNKNGKMLACQDRECGYKKNLAKTTNARCPQCHKRMDLVGDGDGRRFVCVCGFKEKLSTYEQKRKDGPGKTSKKDVADYMKKQQKEAKEPINNAFAEALSKIKL